MLRTMLCALAVVLSSACQPPRQSNGGEPGTTGTLLVTLRVTDADSDFLLRDGVVTVKHVFKIELTNDGEAEFVASAALLSAVTHDHLKFPFQFVTDVSATLLPGGKTSFTVAASLPGDKQISEIRLTNGARYRGVSLPAISDEERACYEAWLRSMPYCVAEPGKDCGSQPPEEVIRDAKLDQFCSADDMERVADRKDWCSTPMVGTECADARRNFFTSQIKVTCSSVAFCWYGAVIFHGDSGNCFKGTEDERESEFLLLKECGYEACKGSCKSESDNSTGCEKCISKVLFENYSCRDEWTTCGGA